MENLMRKLRKTNPKIIAVAGLSALIIGVILFFTVKALYYRVRYLSTVDKVMPESGTITTWYSEDVGAQVIDVNIQYWRQDRGTWSNIKHAVSNLNGLSIAPGESFSWLQDIGPCGKEDGYVIGGAYPENTYGGGICMVSTALFRVLYTAKENGMEDLHVYHSCHSEPLYYAPERDDATIDAEHNTDLRAKNESDHNLVIFADVSEENRTVTLRGYVY